jgi:hypothetical protein
MKRFAAAVAAILAGAAAVGAQARPDFTGTWVRAAEQPASVATAGDVGFRTGDMGSGWGTPLTIAHGRDSLVVEYVFFSAYDLQPPIRLAYALDGSESPNNVMIGHAISAQRARVTWRDSALVITTHFAVPREVAAPSGAIELRHTLTLATLTSLIVETTRPGPGGAPLTVRTIYTRR